MTSPPGFGRPAGPSPGLLICSLSAGLSRELLVRPLSCWSVPSPAGLSPVLLVRPLACWPVPCPAGLSPGLLACPLACWSVPWPAGPSPGLLACPRACWPVPWPAGLLGSVFCPLSATVAETEQLLLLAGLYVPGRCEDPGPFFSRPADLLASPEAAQLYFTCCFIITDLLGPHEGDSAICYGLA